MGSEPRPAEWLNALSKTNRAPPQPSSVKPTFRVTW
jgi:hypothetical protein